MRDGLRVIDLLLFLLFGGLRGKEGEDWVLVIPFLQWLLEWISGLSGRFRLCG